MCMPDEKFLKWHIVYRKTLYPTVHSVPYMGQQCFTPLWVWNNCIYFDGFDICYDQYCLLEMDFRIYRYLFINCTYGLLLITRFDNFSTCEIPYLWCSVEFFVNIIQTCTFDVFLRDAHRLKSITNISVMQHTFVRIIINMCVPYRGRYARMG